MVATLCFVWKLNITEEAIKSCITLKTIEKNLTYNLTDPHVLLVQQLRKDLDELYWKYHAQLPKCEGILLQSNSRILVQYACRNIRQAKLILWYSVSKQKINKRKIGYLARVGYKS